MSYNVLQGEMLSERVMTLIKYYGYGVFAVIAILYGKVIEKCQIKSMGINSNF